MNAAASSLIEAIKASFVGGIDVTNYDFNAAYGKTYNFTAVYGSTGTDWDNIPSGNISWYKYGSGGISGWGTLCGVPNACIAVLNLMNLNGTAGWNDQILRYYCQTSFPYSLDDLYAADSTGWAFQPVPDAEVLAHTVANNPLCHVSVSKWANAAGVSMTAGDAYGSGHKTDRCAKVASAVAAFTAGLLNAGITTSYQMPFAQAQCEGCHGYGTSIPMAPDNQGHMDCGECHTDNRVHTNVAKYLVIEDVLTEDGAGNAKDTFNGGDTIVCKVKFSLTGPGTCFVKTVKSRAASACGKFLGLAKNETLMSGAYEWAWSGVVPSCSGAAKVIMTLNAFDYQGGNLLAQAKKVHNFTIS
jgi:hypothetical protein